MSPGDFSEQADAYSRARPGYPAQILSLLCAHVCIRSGDAVAEAGAGTGLFTRLLSGRGWRVTAIEPNAAQSGQLHRL